MKSYLFLVLLLVSCACLSAQYPGWENFTSGNSCRTVALEGDDVWVATSGGIVQIDRLTLDQTYFNHANASLPYNSILGLEFDSQGNKWFYDGYRLCRFDGNTIETFSPEGVYNYINSFQIAGFNDVWLGTDAGGFFHFDGTNYTQYVDWIHNTTPNAADLTLDNLGRVWFSTYDSINLTGDLICWDGQDYTYYNHLNSGLPVTAVSAIAFDAENHLWAGTFMDGVCHFDGTTWTTYNTSNSGLAGNYIQSVNIAPTGEVYIGTTAGLSVFDGANWTTYNTSNSALLSNYVRDATFGENGEIWLATAAGMARLQNSILQVISTSNSGLPAFPINCQKSTSEGVHWIGTFDGLVRYDGQNWTSYHLPGDTMDTVYGLDLDSAGNVWMATRYSGVIKFDGTNFTQWTALNSPLPNNLMQDIAIDSQDRVWVASQRDGLFCLDGDTWTVYNTSNSILPNNYLRMVRIHLFSEVWVSAYRDSSEPGGMVRISNNNWTLFNTANSGLPSNLIHDFGYRDGNFWFATAEGLARFDGSAWQVYNSSNSGLPNNNVISLDFDSADNLWAVTWNNDLVRFDLDDWIVYTGFNSGLIPDNSLYVHVDSEDRVWVGNYHGGLSRFDNELVSVDDLVVPAVNNIVKIYPNPFRENVSIQIEQERSAVLDVGVYNLRGQKVRDLAQKIALQGIKTLLWDGKDEQGMQCSSGIYYLRIDSGAEVRTQKLLLIK